MKNLFIPALLVAFAGIHPGSESLLAQESKKLRVGDAAPALDVEHWIKGNPVSSFQPGQCYVVEFWATWCAPCKDSMPHLSKLQKELGEQIVIIGLSDEDLEVAKKFLDQSKWAERTKYTLGTDPDRSVWKDYMDASGQRGIPTSFLVDGEGKIAWIGHPAGMDRPLKRMLGLEVGDDGDSVIEVGSDMAELMAEEWNSTDAAKPWMDKAVAALRKSGSKYEFSQTTTIRAGMSPDDEQELPLVRKGTVVYGGALGERVRSTTTLDLPMMPEPIETVSNVTLVDGHYFADTESQMSMLPPGMHVMTAKEATALQQEYAQMPQPPTMASFFDPNPIYANPAQNLEALFKWCALDVADESETRVILRGKGSAFLSSVSKSEEDGEQDGVQVELIVDKKSGRPVELVIGSGENPGYQMTFSNFAAVDEMDLAALVMDVDKDKLPSLADAIRTQMEMMMNMRDQGSPDGEGGFEAEVEF